MREALLLSVAIPTYNEAANLPILIERLSALLKETPHEILVADDDSPDRTWEVAGRLASRVPHLRCLRRTVHKGLYPAVVDAFNASAGEYLAVLDADMQHDESLLPAMLKTARTKNLKLVVASRYAQGGRVENWSRARLAASRVATAFVAAVLRLRVADPLSGFFLIERKTYLKVLPRLRPRGFKMLMDILGNLPESTAVGELGFTFKPRCQGKSKASLKVATQFLLSLLSLAAARLLRLFSLGR